MMDGKRHKMGGRLRFVCVGVNVEMGRRENWLWWGKRGKEGEEERRKL